MAEAKLAESPQSVRFELRAAALWSPTHAFGAHNPLALCNKLLARDTFKHWRSSLKPAQFEWAKGRLEISSLGSKTRIANILVAEDFFHRKKVRKEGERERACIH